jgi:hypothetical protein
MAKKKRVSMAAALGEAVNDVANAVSVSATGSEPIQEEVESGESVVIPYWRLIRTGAPDVEAGTPPGGRAAWPSLSE